MLPYFNRGRVGLLLLIFLYLSSGWAQSVQITAVNFPSLPATSCTNTPLDVGVQLACANASHVGNTTTVSGTTITVEVEYALGPICLPAIVNSVQNINLGNLPAASYSVVVNGILNGNIVSSANTTLTVNNCCSAVPSFTVSRDTACVGDSLFFNSISTGDSSRLWYEDNVFQGSQLSFGKRYNTAGSYQIKLVVANGSCSDSLVKNILIYDRPAVDLGVDTSFCSGSTLLLDAGAGHDSVRWSDQSGNRSLLVDSAGVYYLEVFRNGCSNSDTIVITERTFETVDLGRDTILCLGDSITLNINLSGASYLWSDSSSQSSFTISEAGLYWVSRTDSSGCISSDTLLVTLDSCGVGMADYGQEPAVSLYPNPAHDYTTLQLADAGPTQVSMFSLQGKLLKQLSFENHGEYRISLDQAPGLYLLLVQTEGHFRQVFMLELR